MKSFMEEYGLIIVAVLVVGGLVTLSVAFNNKASNSANSAIDSFLTAQSEYGEADDYESENTGNTTGGSGNTASGPTEEELQAEAQEKANAAQAKGLTTTLSDTKTITLTWTTDHPDDVDHFNVYRAVGTKPGTLSGYAKIAETEEMSYTDNNTEEDTEYFYAVTTVSKGTKTAEANTFSDGNAGSGLKTEKTISLNDITNVASSGIYCGIRWKVDTDGNLYIGGGTATKTPGDRWNTSSNNTTIKTATFTQPILTSSVFCDNLFYGLTSLTKINAIEKLGTTSNITSMSYMFQYCSSLESVDLSSFNTSNVKYMGHMFDGCSSLTSLDLSNFDTSNVTDINGMFKNCQSLESVDLSSFDTSKVGDTQSMFRNCLSLTSLNLSNFNTSRVIHMSRMFDGCSSLTSLDLSNFDTSAVASMDYMFSDTPKLTNVTWPSNSTYANKLKTNSTGGYNLYSHNG